MATKNRTLIIAIVIIISSWFFVMPVSAQNEAGSTSDLAVTGETVLVQFDAKTSEAQRNQIINEMNGELVDWIAPLNVAVVRSQATKRESVNTSKSVQLNDMLNAARSAPEVVNAEIDGTVNAAFLPNDPEFYSASMVYAPQIINADDAWDFTLGDPSIIIAILDTGVNYNHPEFAGRVVSGYDFINDDADPMDDNGHGTHVAGIAAAGTNNAIGNVGICGGCSMMPVKVLSNTGSGLWSQVAVGITFATDNGARVINLSLGGYSASSTLRDAVEYAQQHGVVVVGAAGNDGRSDPFYPAAFSGVIGVGATDRDDNLWSLSNYGNFIDVVAPGHIIFSTFNDLNNYYGGYAFYSGTSMAAPHVSGLVGLILSQDASRNLADVMALLTSGGKDLGASGYDIYYGHGRIDAFTALSQDAPPTAALNGKVWLDSNSNGQPDAAEATGIAQVDIIVSDSNGNVYPTVTGADGQWHVGSLAEGAYTVDMHVPSGYFETSITSHQVSLLHGQQMDGLNFGLTDSLPSDSISNFRITRDENQVTVEWIITRDEVQLVTVERGLALNEAFTTVGELQAQIVGTNTVIRVTDQLPEELTDVTVYYRLRVNPTGLVVGPLASVSSTGGSQIFLPMAINN